MAIAILYGPGVCTGEREHGTCRITSAVSRRCRIGWGHKDLASTMVCLKDARNKDVMARGNCSELAALVMCAGLFGHRSSEPPRNLDDTVRSLRESQWLH
jgi:hypothetical protein